MESCYWVFTYNAKNNVQGAYEDWPDKDGDYKTGKGATVTVTCTLGQEERGETGNFHLQGYVEFKKKIKLTTLKNNFNERIHWEVRKGTAEEAWHYAWKDMDCTKFPLKGPNEMRYPDTRWKHGDITKVSKGSRSDLEAVKNMVLSGKKRKEIAMENAGAYMKYHRGIDAWAQAVEINIDDDVSEFHKRECYIFYGMAGSGKTLSAKRLMYGDSYYTPQKNAQGQYSFETYRGEKWLFLDEYEPKCLDCSTLKSIMDGGRCVLPARGTGNSRPGKHIGVVITSNLDPETWYKETVHWKAISRRCKQVWMCGNPEDGDDALEDPWMIVGGTEFPRGHKVDSPLQDLIAWATAEAQKSASSSENPSQPMQSQSQEVIDLSQDE